MNSPLEKKNRTQLYAIAQKRNIPNRSKMTKEELIAALRTPEKKNALRNIIVLVEPQLYYDDTYIDVPEAKLKTVVSMYTQLAPSAVSESVNGCEVAGVALLGKHIAVLIQVSQKISQDDIDVIVSMLMNIDDDGKYKIKVGKKEYTLVGDLAKVFV